MFSQEITTIFRSDDEEKIFSNDDESAVEVLIFIRLQAKRTLFNEGLTREGTTGLSTLDESGHPLPTQIPTAISTLLLLSSSGTQLVYDCEYPVLQITSSSELSSKLFNDVHVI